MTSHLGIPCPILVRVRFKSLQRAIKFATVECLHPYIRNPRFMMPHISSYSPDEPFRRAVTVGSVAGEDMAGASEESKHALKDGCRNTQNITTNNEIAAIPQTKTTADEAE